MKIVLYRRRPCLTSGAGQLIRMQAEGLRAAGEDVLLACKRGAFKFLLSSGLLPRRASIRTLEAFAASPEHVLVDHQMTIPEADVIFVHNLMTEAIRYVPREDWRQQASQEAAFFRAVRPDVPIVANSELVRHALLRHFALDPARVVVQYPGFQSDRFSPHIEAVLSPDRGTDARAASIREAAQVRAEARASLGIGTDVPLIGFVTSGELDKRGLDIFLASAEIIAQASPDTRFLIVGGKRMPPAAARHPLVSDRRVLHRPKSRRPERWFRALDIFVFPARFEEFGMVVSEAQASGLPVLTSRRVGAAECLPPVYRPWLLDEPDADEFAAKTLELLANEQTRLELARAGVASIAAFGEERYVRETVALIRQCSHARAGGTLLNAGATEN